MKLCVIKRNDTVKKVLNMLTEMYLTLSGEAFVCNDASRHFLYEEINGPQYSGVILFRSSKQIAFKSCSVGFESGD